MSILNNSVSKQLDTLKHDIFHVSGAVKKWWNAQRKDKKTEVCVLGGWYWSCRGKEAGPFRTRDGARRDLYFQMVLHQQPPLMSKRDVKRSEREIAKAETAPYRLPSSRRVSIPMET